MAVAVSMADATRRFTSEPRKLLIGGQWRDSASGKTFETYDPATGAVLATVAEGDKQDVDLALESAAAFRIRIAEQAGNARGAKIVANLVDEVTRLHYLMPSLEAHIESREELDDHITKHGTQTSQSISVGADGVHGAHRGCELDSNRPR